MHHIESPFDYEKYKKSLGYKLKKKKKKTEATRKQNGLRDEDRYLECANTLAYRMPYDADVIALQELRWKESGVLRGRKDEADLYIAANKTGMSSDAALHWEVVFGNL